MYCPFECMENDCYMGYERLICTRTYTYIYTSVHIHSFNCNCLFVARYMRRKYRKLYWNKCCIENGLPYRRYMVNAGYQASVAKFDAFWFCQLGRNVRDINVKQGAKNKNIKTAYRNCIPRFLAMKFNTLWLHVSTNDVVFVNWTLGNKFQWNLNKNITILFNGNLLENEMLPSTASIC